ncbi:hypothetical protein RJ640_013202 [Escallonia rubra]|uniref:Uncharacterized protein n=1 Tax=Escallonia rubra TaxID=112253 RepID=A0AA88U861_9ASTE|nr:hypothetical protein RJ640_013202 [Escallonia rubra]
MHNGLVVVGNESLMKSIFMRVLLCKIHCPSFICFCKPSAAHLYTPGPLKLENSPHVPSSVVSVTDTSNHFSGEAIEGKEGNLDAEKKQHAEIALRSCIRKVSPELGAPNEVQRKRVQWVDKLGKELVEIKEFESRCSDHSDEEYELCRGTFEDAVARYIENSKVAKTGIMILLASAVFSGNSRRKLFHEKERTDKVKDWKRHGGMEPVSGLAPVNSFSLGAKVEMMDKFPISPWILIEIILSLKSNSFNSLRKKIQTLQLRKVIGLYGLASLANPMLEILPCKSLEETSSSTKESGVKTHGSEDPHWIKRHHGNEDFEMESVTGFASDSESQRTRSKVQQSELKYRDLKPNLELLKDELGMKILKEDLDRRRACFCSSG